MWGHMSCAKQTCSFSWGSPISCPKDFVPTQLQVPLHAFDFQSTKPQPQGEGQRTTQEQHHPPILETSAETLPIRLPKKPQSEHGAFL